MMTFSDNMLLGLGIMLAAGEVPRIAQQFGLDTLNPIIDWTKEDVWEYLNSRNIPHCRLYDEGFDRIGCIGCPLAGPIQMRFEFARYPKYEKAYLRAFEKMLKAREGNGKPYQKWKTGEDVMRWWLGEEKKQQVDGDQLRFSLLEDG